MLCFFFLLSMQQRIKQTCCSPPHWPFQPKHTSQLVCDRWLWHQTKLIPGGAAVFTIVIPPSTVV
jgi:hypothetical protein